MADDKVQIDPEFTSPRTYPEDRQGRHTGPVVAAVGAIAVFALGWLFGVATRTPETEDAPVLASTTTGDAGTTSTTAAGEIDSEPDQESTGLDAPLESVVPGFVDTITMNVWDGEGVSVQRWSPDATFPRRLLTLAHDDGWPIGIDASGSFLARMAPNGVIVVDPFTNLYTPVRLGDGEAIGVRAESAVWHATEPAMIAWLELPRGDESHTAIVRTLDVSDDGAEPVDVLEIPFGEHEHPSLDEWQAGTIKIAIWDWETSAPEPKHRWILITDDGGSVEVADSWLVATAPDDTTLWTPVRESDAPAGEPFLLAPGGGHRSPVPGVTSSEWVNAASWSPNGRYLAVSLQSPNEGTGPDMPGPSRFSIVDTQAGTTLFALDPQDEWIGEPVWSPDGTRIAIAVESRHAGTGSFLRVIDASGLASGTEPQVTDVDTDGWVHPSHWSSNGRFVIAQIFRQEPEDVGLLIYDAATEATQTLPVAGQVEALSLSDLRPPVDPDGNPSVGPPSSDGILSGTEDTLPLGEVTVLPENVRLDFLMTTCSANRCYRDAGLFHEQVQYTDPGVEILYADRPPEGEGTWSADAPFHVFHGFVNDDEEPLGPGYEVVLHVTRREGPDLDDGRFPIDETFRYHPDYVLRGTTPQCGPGYRDQGYPVTCEWFVHDFPDGLPEGRYDLWAEWFAPCSAWEEFDLIDACDDPNAVTSEFAGGVNMPFGNS